jgi:galactonate dehydratase
LIYVKIEILNLSNKCGGNMKITAISTVVVNALMRNWVFVKIETDQPGLMGWGEASLEWKTRAVVGAVQDTAELLIGADPQRIEHIWQMMYRQQFFKGGVVIMSAISGIDQALHDIAAKDFGVPLYRLLGGLVRDRVRMYDHLGGGASDAVYNEASVEKFVERAKASVNDGFTAMKILAVPRTEMLDGAKGIRDSVQLMGAVREAVGDDVDVMIDLHGRTTPAMAIQYGHALAQFRPWFFEEPCQPENVDAMVEVARALPIPIATGERLVTRWQFRELLEKRACSIIQPDVCHCGGVTEIKKIASMAETYFISMAPHNPLGPLATMVNIQVGFSTPNFLIQEVMRSDVPWRYDVVDDALDIRSGYIYPPTRPGIGIEINEQEAAKHPYQPELEMRYFHPDSSVADW